MRIDSVQQKPNFMGITKKLSRNIFVDGKKDICELLNAAKPKNTYAGELPPVLFEALPEAKISEGIKDIYKTFGEVADMIRNFRVSISAPADEYKNRRPQEAVQKLKALFVKYGLLKETDNFDILYLGAGEYKKAFKLEGIKDKKSGEEICLKVFHLVDKTPEWHKYKTHGNYAEINTSIYWKRQHGMNTQRGKFYWGDIEHGYFVDKFVDKNTKPPRDMVNEYDEGLKLTDEVQGSIGHNKLYGYSIDPGGVRVVNRVKNTSKIAKNVLKRIKRLPYKYRPHEWYHIKQFKEYGDRRQKEAGLSICIKELPNKDSFVEECLNFHNSFADMGIGYALKYLSKDSAEKYFEVLMKRQHPDTQTVLLNEIPLLARERLDKLKIDDLDVPKGEIDAARLEKFYRIAEKYVLPETENHLASYVHLLPKDKIIPAAKKLIDKNNYTINDRLLHKIKFVKEEEYSFADKMEVLSLIEKVEQNPFLKDKLKYVRTYIIRNSLEE